MGLADQLAGSQGVVEVVVPLLVVGSLLGGVEGDPGQGGEDQALGSVGGTEGGGALTSAGLRQRGFTRAFGA